MEYSRRCRLYGRTVAICDIVPVGESPKDGLLIHARRPMAITAISRAAFTDGSLRAGYGHSEAEHLSRALHRPELAALTDGLVGRIPTGGGS